MSGALGERRHLIASVVGHDSQAVETFLKRAQQLTQVEDKPLRSVWVRPNAHWTANRPASADQWKARILSELGSRGVRTLDRALSQITRERGVLIVIGPLRLETIYGDPNASVRPADLDGLRDFVESLPELLRFCKPHHLRIVIGVEHGERDAPPPAPRGLLSRLWPWGARQSQTSTTAQTLEARWQADFAAWSSKASSTERKDLRIRPLPLKPLELPDFAEIRDMLEPFDVPPDVIDAFEGEYRTMGAASLKTIVTRVNALIDSHDR